MESSTEERPTVLAMVDTSLIDEMLRLSPAERLRQNDRMASLAVKLRAAFSRRERPWSKPET